MTSIYDKKKATPLEKDLDAVLKKHNSRLVPQLQYTPNGIFPAIAITPIEEKGKEKKENGEKK